MLKKGCLFLLTTLGEGVFAMLGGSIDPFPNEMIKALYGDAVSFLRQFEAAAQKAVAAGVVMPRDVAKLVDKAKRVLAGVSKPAT